MGATAAYQSTLKTGATTINNIKTIDVGTKIAALDTTSFSAATPGTESFIGGLLGGQIKFSGQYDKADTGQSTIETNYFARTITSFVYSPNGTNTYTFTALITEYGIKSEVKDLVTVEMSLQLVGGITIA